MNKRFIVLLAAIFVASLPLTAVAMEEMVHDHSSHAGMEHTSKDNMNHGSMAMSGNMIMLGEQEVDGVEAMVHLKDVKEAMSKMGMSTTHHFMVMFVDTTSGGSVESGIAAVKIIDPAGVEGETTALMGMKGHFGVDITLSIPGDYVFKLGTKLADGKKRQYEFKYTQQ